MRVKSTGLIPVRSTIWGISLVVKTIRRWFESNILHKVNPLWVATMVVGKNWLPLERERRYPVFSPVTWMVVRVAY